MSRSCPLLQRSCATIHSEGNRARFARTLSDIIISFTTITLVDLGAALATSPRQEPRPRRSECTTEEQNENGIPENRKQDGDHGRVSILYARLFPSLYAKRPTYSQEPPASCFLFSCSQAQYLVLPPSHSSSVVRKTAIM
jgi:hypothetical protein